MSAEVIRAYYQAFNRQDHAAMLALLAPDVAHDINEGGRETGRERFAAFLAHMDRCYREQVADLVVLTSADGSRAAAEFTVHGTYLASDAGLPEASGQAYTLPAGAFFSLDGGRITRVTTYYNLKAWLAQVAG